MKSFHRNIFGAFLAGLVAILALSVSLAGCSRSATGGLGFHAPGLSGWAGQPGGKLLWTVDRLKDAIDGGEDFVLVDARLNQADFDAGHIPGAIWIDWRWLANDPPATFPPEEDVETKLGDERGIVVTDKIVIYGDGALNREAPFRLFWMFEYYGCKDVHLVDGGFFQWKAKGYTVDNTPWNPGSISPAKFVSSIDDSGLAVASGIQDFVENQVTTNKVVIDARTAWEFSGEATEYYQDRAGRIPYSKNLWWLDLIDLETNMLDDPGVALGLIRQGGFRKNKDNIAVATTGVRSTVIYFVCRLLGYPCRVYQGGLYNWSDVDSPPLGHLGLVERTGPFFHRSRMRGSLRPHYAGATAVLDDQIYIFGGITYNAAQQLAEVNNGMWRFDTTADVLHEGKDDTAWTDETPAGSPRRFAQCAAAVPSENAIYLFGGSGGSGVYDTIFRCDVDPVSHDFNSVVPLGMALPVKLYGAACAYNPDDGLIYIFGGSTATPFADVSDKTYAFTPAGLGGPAITEKASLPSGRTLSGGVALNGKIYCLGGQDGDGNVLDEVLEYDPVADTWTPVASMTMPRLGAPGAVVSGRIYMCGGLSWNADSGYFTTGLVESFDPAKASEGWKVEDEMAIPRYDQFTAVVDGGIFMLGGYNGPPNLTANGIDFLNVVEYRPGSETKKAAMPAPLYVGAAATLGGKVYLFGGNSEGALTDRVLEYDPIADSYADMDPLPMGAVRGASAAAFGGKILVCGGAVGYSPSQPVKTAFLFDPAQAPGSQWTQVADMPANRFGAAAAYYNDTAGYLGLGADLVFVMGGKDWNDYNQVTTFVYDAASDTWYDNLFGLLPRARAWSGAAVIGDSVYLTGGQGNQGLPLPDTLKLDLDPASSSYLVWEFVGAMPTARYGQGCAVIGDRFYNIGGFVPVNNKRNVTGAVEVFDAGSGRWTILRGMDDAKAHPFTAAAPNASGGTSIYVIGGYAEVPSTVYFDDTVEVTR